MFAGKSPVFIHSAWHTDLSHSSTVFCHLLLLISLSLFFRRPSSSSTHLPKTYLDTEECVYETHIRLTHASLPGVASLL